MTDKARRVHFKNGLSGLVAGSEGPPVILLHAIGMSSITWRHVQPVLAEGCQTLALDLLGFGASAKPIRGDYSLQAQAERVLQVADELGWDSVELVGNSLGGGVSLAAAIAARERVGSLALVDTVAFPGGMPPLRMFTQVPLAEHPVRLTSALAAWASMVYCFADWRRLDRESIRTYAGALGTREGARAFRLTSQALYGTSLAALVRHYPEIRCPTLIVHGERDPIIPRWVPLRLATAIATAELRWLHGVGHFPQEEAPEQVVVCLSPFLLRRDRAAA